MDLFKCLQNTSQIFLEFHLRGHSITTWKQLGSVAGPVIQANGRMTFEDDLRSGGLLCFTTQSTSIRTGVADSMVTLGETGDG